MKGLFAYPACSGAFRGGSPERPNVGKDQKLLTVDKSARLGWFGIQCCPASRDYSDLPALMSAKRDVKSRPPYIKHTFGAENNRDGLDLFGRCWHRKSTQRLPQQRQMRGCC